MSKFFSLVKQSLGISTPASRKVAKERLSIMLVHQRNSELLSNIDMESLQKEVAVVVRKYIKLADDRPSHLQVRQEGEYDFLEMNFQLVPSVSGGGKRDNVQGGHN